MKRRYLVFIFILCVFGSLFFVGCNCKKEKNPPVEEAVYYYVTFDADNGTTPNMVRVESGKTVSIPEQEPTKDGYTFLYWSSNTNERFNFDTIIENHITLVAIYVSNEVKTTRVIWNEDEAIHYVFDNGVPRTVEVGSTVQFKVTISPYYEGELEVTINDKKITKLENGYYEFIAEDVTLMNVSTHGLMKQDTNIKGGGTKENPYIISNASQFKAFTDGVNSSTETKYNEAYIVLEDDIDFNGYTIDIIGDTLNTNEFSGHFNGKNHTISNFNLNSKNGLFGLFGYLVIGEVTNLNIEANLVCVPTNEYYNLIGTLVAYNIASDIMNCNFSGTVDVKNELNKTAEVYVGGLVGYMQSYSDTYSAGLSYSTTNAEITSSGSVEVTSQGGLVGLLFGSDISVPAYVYNCSFQGSVKGLSLASGGIVGTLRKNSSVANCYATGEVKAFSASRTTSAGAIIGIAENETSVTYSFSTSTVESSNPNSNEWITGTIIGSSYKDGHNGMDDRKVLEVENYHSISKKIMKDDITYDLDKLQDVMALLHWSSCDWNNDFTPNYEEGESIEFNIYFDFGRELTYEGLDGSNLTQVVDTIKTTGYLPLYWIYNGSGMNNFVADDGTISYGYYLDEERTIKVPASYIITSETTIYVGFADYSDVVGQYYVSLKNKDIELTFDNNGKMTMYYDGVIANYMYVYDGNKIVIKNAYFAYIEYPSLSGTRDLDVDYYAEIDGDTLIIYNIDFFPKDDGLEMTAHKRNAAMGKWYSQDNQVYTFLSDGTGSIDSGATFKYECDGTNVTIAIGKDIIKATISSDGQFMEASSGEILSIYKYDEFMGLWEAEFVNPDEISFDGKGTVVYKDNTYTYVIDKNGVLTFDEYQAYFNEKGMLVLEHNGKEKVFGMNGSYIGTWTDTTLDYWVIFEGISKDGYGYGYDSYGISFTYLETGEETDMKGFITMYYGTQMYGYGEMVVGENGTYMLYLAVYTPSSGMIVDDYNVCYIDSFFGDWNGENGISLSFNGLGGYDIYEYIYTLQEYWDVRGFVTITENGVETTVRYDFDRDNASGKFIYKNQTYNIVFDGENLLINGEVYKHPDVLNDYAYQVDDMIFTFNGKSNVNLGKVIITINNHSEEYSYRINETIVEIYNETGKVYTLTMGTNYELVDANGTKYELGLYHKLIGNIYAISHQSQLEFSKPFDIHGVTKAYLQSDNQRYELDAIYIDSGYIALYLNGTFIYYVYYLDDNCAALCNRNFTPIGVVAKEDELRGTWVSEDEKVIIFDGLSGAINYTKATCEVDEQDETGTYLEQYTYEKQQNYYVILSIENNVEIEKYYVYTEYVENAIEYKQGDKTIYVVVVTD